MEEKCFCHLNGYKVKDAEARNTINTIKNSIGEMENLNTEDKTNLVNAINELVNSSSSGGAIEELLNANINIWSTININPGVYLISGKNTTITYMSGSYKPLLNDVSKYVMIISRCNNDNNNSGCGCVIFEQGLNYMDIRYICWSTNISIRLTNILTTNGEHLINGRKVFNILPESSVEPTTDNQLVNKKYVDDSVANISGGGSGSSVDLSNYYNKDETNNLLANKVDTSTFEGELANKVDTSTFESELTNKVDTSTYESGLASKVDTTTYESGLANKVDTSTYNSKISEIESNVSNLTSSSHNVLYGTTEPTTSVGNNNDIYIMYE